MKRYVTAVFSYEAEDGEPSGEVAERIFDLAQSLGADVDIHHENLLSEDPEETHA